MKKILFTALAALGLWSAAYAVPAKPGWRTFTQPDGSTVTVRLVGDERVHYYVSEDDYPLIEDARGRLCYAQLNSDGVVVASPLPARDVVRRVAGESALMARNDAATMRSKLAKQMLENSPFALPQVGMGLSATTFPSEGDVRSLVILVNYSDVKFKTSNPHDYFSRLLNEENFSDYRGTGSARDFYMQASSGKFRPTFDVVGPVDLPQTRNYYGGNDSRGNDKNPEMMVVHACEILDNEIDFSVYDVDHDGVVDNIYVFYAGEGEASSNVSAAVWPHSWNLLSAGRNYSFDGVKLDHYACSNEWLPGSTPDGIGTFCHEFGHVLGLPDLYDTEYSNDKNGLGDWAIMCGGSYNNNSRTPPTFSAYERNALGWLDLEVLPANTSVELEPLIDSNFAYLLPTEKENEFFLFENRQQQGWDTYLPYHGMLVWHIDYKKSIFDKNQVNNTIGHQYVDIVEAGGPTINTNASSSAAQRSVPFPGRDNVTSYTFDTNPSFASWSGKDLGMPITNIAETNGIITFDVCGGVSELAAPVNLKVVATSPYSVDLKWDAVEYATRYQLTVSDADGKVLPKYNALVVRGTEYTFNGLQPETSYHFAISAKAGKVLSEPTLLDAATGKITFEYMTVNALAASNISERGFTANWEPIEGAVDYEISISTIASGAPEQTVAESGIDLPSGWTTSAERNYTTAQYSGKSAPAARFDADKGHLTTALTAGEITSIAFWYRGIINVDGNSIEVQFRPSADTDWTTAHTINPMEMTGTNVSYEAPAGSHQARIVYNRPSSGSLALDDVTITVVSMTKQKLEGYQSVSTGKGSSYDFRVTPDMNAGREFGYTVVGVDADGMRTLPSQEIKVELNESTGVDNVAADELGLFSVQGKIIEYCGHAGAIIYIYDAAGTLMGTAVADAQGHARYSVSAPGFYVATAAGSSFKALCR